MKRIPTVKRGDAITAEWANAIAQAVNVLLGISVADPLELTSSSSGIGIRLASDPSIIIGRLTSDLTRGGVAQLNVEIHDGSSWAETGRVEEINDSIPWIPSGKKLPSGTRIGAFRNGRVILPGFWDCEDLVDA